MGTYQFGYGIGAVSKSRAEKINKIAERYVATFVNVNMPGEGPRYWFECANHGAPFDRLTERQVLSDVAKEVGSITG
jgi:hypothetical protein